MLTYKTATSSHVCLGLTSDLFPRGLRTKRVYVSFPMRGTYPSLSSIFFYLSIIRIRRRVKMFKFLMQFSLFYFFTSVIWKCDPISTRKFRYESTSIQFELSTQNYVNFTLHHFFVIGSFTYHSYHSQWCSLCTSTEFHNMHAQILSQDITKLTPLLISLTVPHTYKISHSQYNFTLPQTEAADIILILYFILAEIAR